MRCNMICIDRSLINRQYIERAMGGCKLKYLSIANTENTYEQFRNRDKRENKPDSMQRYSKRCRLCFGDGDYVGYGDGNGSSKSANSY